MGFSIPYRTPWRSGVAGDVVGWLMIVLIEPMRIFGDRGLGSRSWDRTIWCMAILALLLVVLDHVIEPMDIIGDLGALFGWFSII